jgi:triacylglycerol lipase
MTNASNPVILVHGLHDTSAKMRSIANHLVQRGRQVHSIDLQPNDGTAPLQILASQLQEFIDRQLPIDSKFDLIGFSMGGLVSRYYMQRLGGIKRVEHYVTIAAPHQPSQLTLRKNLVVSRCVPIALLFKTCNKMCKC